ncbi:MAG TPA: Ig-like domain-containing protein [Kofleriaceae bacterium]|nr:Ig-like domain-containing protein [Kofleriaceae bacterium]
MIRTSLVAFVVLLASSQPAAAQSVVVFDDFPPAGTPLSAEGFSVQRFLDPPDVVEIEHAVRFVAPAEPLRLDALALGVFRGAEDDGAIVIRVSVDGPGGPSDDVVDTIEVPSDDVPVFSDETPPPLVVASVQRPVLEPGQAYWVSVSPAPPTDAARIVTWAVGGTANGPVAGRTSVDPDTESRGPWNVFTSNTLLRVEAAPPNSAPDAAADAYAVDEDGVLAVAAPGVLANDRDPDGDAITAVLERAPAHGTLALDEEGGFIYRPAPDYSGPDGFAYRATDGDLTGDPVEVAIAVGAVDDPPVNVLPGPQSLSLGLLQSAQFDLQVVDVDAGELPLRVTLVATGGQVSLSGVAGLTFSAGDGTRDARMTFTGTLPAIDAALTGMRYTPSFLAFFLGGGGTVQITTTDLRADGSAGPSDTDTLTITRG